MEYLKYYRKKPKQNKFVNFMEKVIDFLDKFYLGFILIGVEIFLIRVMFF